MVDGKSPRLMLFMPPRHGKSFIASERFPVWHLGRNPTHQVLMTSYGQVLSDRFSKRARALAQSQLVIDTFEMSMNAGRQAVHEWETTEGGAYRAVGIGGGATGTGCNILIIDDPIKNAEEANSKAKRESDWEWYQTTAYTRGMPGFGVLIIQTRWHEDDLSGRLLAAAKKGEGDDWEVVSYSAIADHDDENRKAGEPLHAARYDIEKLTQIRRAIGLRAWNSLYQQRPGAIEGTLFKRSWWKYYTELPNRFERIVASWDCAFKGGEENDFVVGLIVGKIGSDYYVIGRRRGQMDFVETIGAVKQLSTEFPQAKPILIEDAANGPAVISSLKGKISGIVGFQPKGSKESRATIVTPLAEAGNIYLPDGATWLDEFIEEFASFPRGANDDQVDALTQSVMYLEQEGKLAVFNGITEAFGNPREYFTADWHTTIDGPREVFIGVKWGFSVPHKHTFYALGVTGATLGYQRIETSNHNDVVRALKQFVRFIAGDSQPVVFYEASETMGQLLKQDTEIDWRLEPIKITEAMAANLRDAIEQKTLTLKPWTILFDQMAAFRCEITEKGSMIYGSPEGLSSNAVFALMLAHEAWIKYGNQEASIAVVNQLEEMAARIYYGGGTSDEIFN